MQVQVLVQVRVRAPEPERKVAVGAVRTAASVASSPSSQTLDFACSVIVVVLVFPGEA